MTFGVGRGGLEVGDVGAVRHAGEVVDLAPGRRRLLGDLHQAVVGADVEQAFLHRRLGEGDDVAVERGRAVVGDGVDAPDPSHDLELVAVDLARQVGADRLPGVAAVVAAEQLVGGEVEPGVGVRADDDGRVPVPAQRRARRLPRLRLDVELLAGLAVEAHQAAVLRLGVDDVGVFGVDLRLEAVAALGDEPVGVADAVAVDRPRGAAEADVVLGAAVTRCRRAGVVQARLGRTGRSAGCS